MHKVSMLLAVLLFIEVTSKAQEPVVRTAGEGGSAGRRVLVLDADAREPVARASLYTKDDGPFRAAISDEKGVARVTFPFRHLTVSHLNYEQQQLRQLPDTIWMRPRYRQTTEVVVTNKEPEWIRRKLLQAVKQKEQHYFSCSDTTLFSYHTESIDKRSLYRYHLTGLLRMRDADHKLYAIQPDTSIIVSSDSTRLTDVTNLRRMLSEDFMQELTKNFINDHRWAEDPDYEGRHRGEVELVFRSKHRTDDRGRLVLDTIRCVVLQAYRFTGTETNRHERMPMALYAMARVLTGYKVDTWTRYYQVRYGERENGTFFPQTVSYKMYLETQDNDTDEETNEFSEQTGGGFPNMEATLHIKHPDKHSPTNTEAAWHELPGAWYLRYGTEESRQQEINLANLPADFHIIE